MKFVTATLATIPLLADIYGKKLPKGFPRISRKKQTEMASDAKELFATFGNLSKLESPRADPREELERLHEISGHLSGLGLCPKGVYIAEYYASFYQSIINSPGYEGYLARSGYRRYRDAIATLIGKLYSAGLGQKGSKFIQDFESSTEGRLVAQPMISGFRKRNSYLRRRRRGFSKKDIDRMIEIYRELAGIYEKLVMTLVGLFHMIEGREAPFEEVRQWSLASHVQYVQKRSPELAKAFSITIRNAISHTTYSIHFSESSVDFHDKRHVSKSTFKEFYDACRLLNSLVFALSLVKVHFSIADMKSGLEYYRHVKKMAKAATKRKMTSRER